MLSFFNTDDETTECDFACAQSLDDDDDDYGDDFADIECRSLPEISKDPLLQLVSLQNASGSWLLDAALATAIGKTSQEVENTKPSGVSCHQNR